MTAEQARQQVLSQLNTTQEQEYATAMTAIGNAVAGNHSCVFIPSANCAISKTVSIALESQGYTTKITEQGLNVSWGSPL